MLLFSIFGENTLYLAVYVSSCITRNNSSFRNALDAQKSSLVVSRNKGNEARCSKQLRSDERALAEIEEVNTLAETRGKIEFSG